jgi:hypothetical protein
MTKTMRETTSVIALGSVTEERNAVKTAFQEVQSSFENFCLLAGIEAFQDLLEDEAADLCGERHQRHEDRRGRRWGKARSPVAFHGGRVDIERPRVRTPDGQQELELPSLAAGQREDWLGRWAMNQMLINVSTRRFRRSVRLPDGDVASAKGDGTSKSAVSRKFVALSSAKLKDWMATDLSPLDLLAIQIDGLHVQEDLILVAAVGIDATGEKHPLGLVEGATENAATVQALLDNLVERSLACTNIIENMNGTIRQVTRNVKRWRDASMALRWTAAGMMEAKKGFRRLMAYKQLPTLKAALLAHQAAPSATPTSDGALACTGEAA